MVGLDLDGEKLGLARRAASERGLTYVAFRSEDVLKWNEPGAYDVGYSRFLLQHLNKPVGLVRHMWSAVRPRGVLVIEYADFDGWTCHPPNDGFGVFLRVYAEVVRRLGGDPACVRKLYRYFEEAGVPTPDIHALQPVAVRGEAKDLPRSTLESIAPAAISEGVATPTEVESALAGLETFLRDD